jgi:hypothetical protein
MWVAFAIDRYFCIIKRRFAAGIFGLKFELPPILEKVCKRLVERPMDRTVMLNAQAVSILRLDIQ